MVHKIIVASGINAEGKLIKMLTKDFSHHVISESVDNLIDFSNKTLSEKYSLMFVRSRLPLEKGTERYDYDSTFNAIYNIRNDADNPNRKSRILLLSGSDNHNGRAYKAGVDYVLSGVVGAEHFLSALQDNLPYLVPTEEYAEHILNVGNREVLKSQLLEAARKNPEVSTETGYNLAKIFEKDREEGFERIKKRIEDNL